MRKNHKNNAFLIKNMKIKEIFNNEKQFLKEGADKNFALGLLFATIILFVYCYFGSYGFFEKTFAGIQNLDYYKIIYHNCMAFVLFFGLGIIFTKFILKQKLRDFGLQAGNYKLGLKLCLIALPICALCGLSCVLDSDMSAMYPLINFNLYSWWQIAIYFVSYLLYYIGWEYLFRGILFFGAEKKCGVLCSILVGTLISALIHTGIAGFGKPMIETLSAIPAGMIFGYVTAKTRSINYSLIMHLMVGVFTDIFIFSLV